MIKTSRQLKDLINNLARKNAADAQLLMRNYMMERFLERVSLSQFRENFILKGGMLVAAMVGLDTRSTMDIDATVRSGCRSRQRYDLRDHIRPGQGWRFLFLKKRLRDYGRGGVPRCAGVHGDDVRWGAHSI